VPFADRFSETSVAKVVDYLAANDDSCAELKADVARTKYLAELAEYFAFKGLTVGTVADKQAEAQMDKSVQEKWELHFKAIAAYEKARAIRERGQMIFEGWRSASANRRQANV
jgi:predicted RNA-binding protein with PIN domain